MLSQETVKIFFCLENAAAVYQISKIKFTHILNLK